VRIIGDQVVLPLRSDFAQRIVSHVYKIPMPSGDTSRYVLLTYKYATVTIRPMDHAESVVSLVSRSPSAERKPKRNAAWEAWIRWMDTCSQSCREGGSTECGVKRERVEEKGRLMKGWTTNVPNYVGARNCHSAVSRSFSLRVQQWAGCQANGGTQKHGVNLD